MAKESIKEQVKKTAEGDPFLTIEEIAELVETTPRYVRTILSEARLSLHQLRRDYARNMERRLGFPKSTPIKDMISPGLRVVRRKCPEASLLLNLPPNQELQVISQTEDHDGIKRFVELYTYLDISIRPDIVDLREVLKSTSSHLKVSNFQVEVVRSSQELCYLLAIRSDELVYRLSIALKQEGKPIAVEIQWLPVNGVRLRWDGQAPKILTTAAI